MFGKYGSRSSNHLKVNILHSKSSEFNLPEIDKLKPGSPKLGEEESGTLPCPKDLSSKPTLGNFK